MSEFKLCSNCFSTFALRKISEQKGLPSTEACLACGSPDGKKLNEQTTEEVMKVFFESGSVHSKDSVQPKYRIRKSNIPAFQQLVLQQEVKADCELVFNAFKLIPVHNQSRFVNMGIWGLNAQLKKFLSQEPTDEAYDRFTEFMMTTIDKFQESVLKTGTKVYKIRKNPKIELGLSTPEQFDSTDISNRKRMKTTISSRFGGTRLSVLYASFNMETCLHELQVGTDDETILGTLEVTRDLKILDLCEPKNRGDGSYETTDLAYFMSRLFFSKNYLYSSVFSVAAKSFGYDGVKYRSYFSKIREGEFYNLAVFGKPIADGRIKLCGVNRLRINSINYKFSFGPVHCALREGKEIQRILDLGKKKHKEFMDTYPETKNSETKISFRAKNYIRNVHSLATVRQLFDHVLSQEHETL